MPCYSPIKAWYSRELTKDGKRFIVFNPAKGYADKKVDIPCGQCIGCRLERSRQWAVRIMHEASLHENSCFVTLTYDDAHLPADGSLCLDDFQRFMKRLRKNVAPEKVRFFHCGEYGEKLKRPHYHVAFFGIDFRDRSVYTINDALFESSKTLSELWPLGFNTVGELTFESASYIARYITKKITGEKKSDHYAIVDEFTGEVLHERTPEYITMSRRPGIGYEWFNKYVDDVYPSDSIVVKGKEMKPPKYYDMLYNKYFKEEFKKIKASRMDLSEAVKADNCYDRLVVKEKVTLLNLENKKRRFEND